MKERGRRREAEEGEGEGEGGGKRKRKKWVYKNTVSDLRKVKNVRGVRK